MTLISDSIDTQLYYIPNGDIQGLPQIFIEHFLENFKNMEDYNSNYSYY